MTMVVAFDVNETLLDLSALDDQFVSLFESATPRGEWFASMLQLTLVNAVTGSYVSFPQAQAAALRMVGKRHGVRVTDDDVDRLLASMSALPAHSEVEDALKLLRRSGVPMVALVNSTLDVVQAQLEFAGLAGLFDAVLSADDVKALKPDVRAYEMVATKFSLSLSEVRLVAAHSWDVSGALAAGCRAAFVARPGAVLSPLGPQPDIVGSDLSEVVEQLAEGGPARG